VKLNTGHHRSGRELVGRNTPVLVTSQTGVVPGPWETMFVRTILAVQA
jgi:hypothetical protein